MHENPNPTELERCYGLLQLDMGASTSDVERTWLRLVDEWSPNRFVMDPVLHRQAHVRVKALNHARDVVDQHLRRGRSTDQPEIKTPAHPARTSFPRRPVVASTVFAGVAIVAILIMRPHSEATVRPVEPLRRSTTTSETTPVVTRPAEPRVEEIMLVANAPVTVSVSLVADGRILLPATALQPGQTATVPRLGPTYIKYSSGENLEIEIAGHRYAMPDTGPSRARIK